MAKLLDRLNNKAAVTKLFTSTLRGSLSCKVWGERQRLGMKGGGEKKGERERGREIHTLASTCHKDLLPTGYNTEAEWPSYSCPFLFCFLKG